MPPDDFDVVVIGAGVAGLAALQELDKAGLRVVVLEARDRIGGRIHTVHDPLSPVALELGAEFVHGRPPEIWEIIRDAGLAVYDGTDSSRYMKDGAVVRNAEQWDLVDSVIEDMCKAAQGSDRSFEEFLNSTAYSDEDKRAARGYVEGFNAAKSNVISIQALAEETAAADEMDGDLVFRFSRGYDAVPLHMLRSVKDYAAKLRLNSIVEEVKWRRGAVSVNAGAHSYSAARVIVTVPLGVLQAGSIVFSPEPVGILEAARRLRFGQVFRVVLRFRSAFWEHREELKDAGFIISDRALFPTWWTTLAMRTTTLTGWSGGAHADELIGLGRDEILAQALKSLAAITGTAEEEIRGQLASVYFHNWQADPFAKGAYSYVPAGGLSARREIALPVEDTLYFAGEATDQGGHSATVHGAIASGRRAARQLIESAGGPSNKGF